MTEILLRLLIIIIMLLASLYGVVLAALSYASAIAFAVLPIAIGTTAHIMMRLLKRLK